MSALLSNGDASAWQRDGCGQISLAGPGDLTGDGLADVVLGNGTCLGDLGSFRLYQTSLFPDSRPLLEVAGDPAAIPDPLDPLTAPKTQRRFATALSAAGDLNADGKADLLVGAQHFIGAAFIVFQLPLDTGAVSINELVNSGAALPVRRNAMHGHLGDSIAPAGDFNGDGIDDVLIGVPGGGRSFHGETFLVFGAKDLNETKELDLFTPGPWRIRFHGEFPYDWSGSSLVGLGDLNGDGFDDVGILGSDLWNHDSTAHVIFGAPNMAQEVRLANLGSQGFRLRGASDQSWFSAGPQGGMAAGDLDGDGARDIAIGERTPDGYRVVVIFGGKKVPRFIRGDANFDGTVNISDAIFTLSFLFLGGLAPLCDDAADADDSGRLDITDAIRILNSLFLGTQALPPPFPEEGQDSTPDLLGCLGF